MESGEIGGNSTNSAAFQITRWFAEIPRVFYYEIPIIMGCAGCAFNIVLIWYFLKTRKYRSPTFMMLTSLAFSDLFSCIAPMLSIAIFPVMAFPDARYSCPLFLYFMLIGIYTSDCHLVLFAAVRFYQLAFPLSARARITPQLVLKFCLAIWAAILILLIPQSTYSAAVTGSYNGETITVCNFIGDKRVKDLCFLIVATIIPLVAIVLLHVGKHIAVTCKQGKPLATQHERKNTDARVITIVIVLFFMAWFPAFTYMNIMHGRIANYQNVNDYLFLTLFYFAFYNSVINPLLYCFALKSVRDDIINKFWHRNK